MVFKIINRLLVDWVMVCVCCWVFFDSVFLSSNLYELMILFIGVWILWFILVKNWVLVILVVFVLFSVDVKCWVFLRICDLSEWFNFVNVLFSVCFFVVVLVSVLNVFIKWFFRLLNLLFKDVSFWMCNVELGNDLVFFCVVGLNCVM